MPGYSAGETRSKGHVGRKESTVNIVIAAEKTSIATLLSEYIRRRVNPDELKITENPDETGSFFVGLEFDRYVMSPSGVITADRLQLCR